MYRVRTVDTNNDGAVISDFETTLDESDPAVYRAVNAGIERYAREKNTAPEPRPCIIISPKKD